MGDLISRQYLLDIAKHEDAYGYVSTQEILDAPTITPQGNLISRAEAMAYPLSWEHYDKENGSREFICGVESYRDYIEALPSADADWIPCSERLPKENELDEKKRFYKSYLVCDVFGHLYTARWTGKWWVLWGHGKVIDDVIAWQPLPKPYDGGADMRGCGDVDSE